MSITRLWRSYKVVMDKKPWTVQIITAGKNPKIIKKIITKTAHCLTLSWFIFFLKKKFSFYILG